MDIESFDQNNIKIDEKSYKITLIYYTGYVTIKIRKNLNISKSFIPYFQISEWIL